MQLESNIEPEHIQFLKTVDILKGWPIEKLPLDNPRICYCTHFKKGDLLCKDSNTTEWIYVIKTGSCRVLKDLIETKPNIPGLEFIDYSASLPIKLPPINTPKSHGQRHQRQKSALVQTHGQRHLYRRLPEIKEISHEKLSITATEHLNEINKVFKKRHRSSENSRNIEGTVKPVLAATSIKKASCLKQASIWFPKKGDGSSAHSKTPGVHKVFVQIQKLGPRETFGLEHTTLSMMGQTTGCSIVSDGAECILINKKFFLHHLTDDTVKKIRKTIQPIPTEASLQQKLQDRTNWEAFKTMAITNFIGYTKDLHDFAAIYNKY